MSRLTKKIYWDSIHVKTNPADSAHTGQQEQEEVAPADRPDQELAGDNPATLKGGIKRLLGKSVLERIANYDDYLLTQVILPRFLPDIAGTHFVEIGSAPGEFIVEFSKRYGCIPYGVEYSAVGVEVNRRVFEQGGFAPDNVIHTDFFSADFANRYRDHFDEVLSRGFIEHFEDVRPVIDRHLHVLKPGGYLVISVPNLRGFNYFLSRFFDKGSIARHNLQIMTKKAYSSLFQRADLQTLFCDYYGTLNLCLFTAGPSQVKRRILRFCMRLQPALNFSFRTLCQDKGIESSLFSPSLLYIGRKVSAR